MLVTASAVSNPATTSTGDAVTVSTSSDTAPAETDTYAITAAQAVTSPSVTLTTKAAGATNVTYNVRFTTSSTGALAPYYSTITLAAPAGTVFSSNGSYAIEDVTTGTQCGEYYSPVTSNGGATVTVSISTGCGTIVGGDTVLVTASDGHQPGVDLDGRRRGRHDLLGHPVGPDRHLRHHGGPGGGLAAGHPYDDGGRSDQRHLHGPFTTSSSGGLAPYDSTITLAAPAGTDFGPSASYGIQDVTRGTQCGEYYNPVTSNGGATVTLSPTTGCGTIAGGDTLLVTIGDVSNPASTLTGAAVTVSTSSDTVAALTNSYAITAAQAVTSPSVTLSTTTAGATNVTYDVRFTTSPTGALAPYYSTITLAAPAGHGLQLRRHLHDRGRHDGDAVRAVQRPVTSNGGATVTVSVSAAAAAPSRAATRCW